MGISFFLYNCSDTLEILKKLGEIIPNSIKCTQTPHPASATEFPIDIVNNNKLKYLASYLEKLHCKTILVETNYIDRSYLSDFASYYVRAFPHYRKYCLRLHFFKDLFSVKQFETFLLNPTQKLLDYLGFCVIKPLPTSFLGRTCLIPPNWGSNNFFITVSYKANLYGQDFNVSGLAYQEQDHAVAACATVALWVSFQAVGPLFDILPTPSLSDISTLAKEVFSKPGRVLPSRGMNDGQINYVVQKARFEDEYRSPNEFRDVRNLLYGYLHYKIPIILVINFAEKINHAVTVIGYHLGTNRSPHNPCQNGDFIDEVYVHDDNIGPYIQVTLRDAIGYEVEWPATFSNLHKGKIISIHIPVYEKIRVRYETAASIVTKFHSLLVHFLKSKLETPTEFLWDVFLTDVNSFKREIHLNQDLNSELRMKNLTTEFPHYLWRAIGYKENIPFVDLQIDATDLEASLFIDGLFFYNQTNMDEFKEWMKEIGSEFFVRLFQNQFIARKLFHTLEIQFDA